MEAPKDADEIICNDGESVESKIVKTIKAIGDVENSSTNAIRELDESQKAIQLMLAGKIDDAYVEDGYLYMTSNNEVVVGPLGPFSGGGGGTGNNAVLTVSNTSGWLSKSIASGAECIISLTWTSWRMTCRLATGR